jgi:chromosome segregation ATPase
MIKNKIILVSATGLIFVSAVAFAQTSEQPKPAAVQPERRLEIEKSRQEVKEIRQTTFQTNQEVRKNALDEAQKIRQNTKKEIETERQNTIQGLKAIRQTASTTGDRQAIKEAAEKARQALTQKREAAKEAMENAREDFKQKIEVNRTEAKKQIEARREELKQKLAVIKDARKKATVEKIDAQLQSINAKRLETFSATLNRIEEIIQKVSSRADKAQANGVDVTTVRNDIATFKTALAAARSAIIVQTSKVYTIAVVDETTLKVNVEKARQALQADLKKVQDLVKASHEAARIAATDLAKIPNVNAFKEELNDDSASSSSSDN